VTSTVRQTACACAWLAAKGRRPLRAEHHAAATAAPLLPHLHPSATLANGCLPTPMAQQRWSCKACSVPINARATTPAS
jgi:hypothetical protein